MELIKKIEFDESKITREELTKLAKLQWGEPLIDEENLKDDFILRRGYSLSKDNTGKYLGEKITDIMYERKPCYCYQIIKEICHELGYDEYKSVSNKVEKYLRKKINSYDKWYEKGPKFVEDATVELSNYVDEQIEQINSELNDLTGWDQFNYKQLDEVDEMENEIRELIDFCYDQLACMAMKEEELDDDMNLDNSVTDDVEFFQDKKESISSIKYNFERILKLCEPLNVIHEVSEDDDLVTFNCNPDFFDPESRYEFRYEFLDDIDTVVKKMTSLITNDVLEKKKVSISDCSLQLYPDEIKEIMDTCKYKELSLTERESINEYLGITSKSMGLSMNKKLKR